MKHIITVLSIIAVTASTVASSESKVTLNDFYRPFERSEITPKNMQSWPYYRYTSMNGDEYGLFRTAVVMAAKKPAKLRVAREPFDIEQDDFHVGHGSISPTLHVDMLERKENVIFGLGFGLGW